MECKRIRKNFLDMTELERCRYIRAVKKASTVEPFKSEYNQLIAIHEILFLILEFIMKTTSYCGTVGTFWLMGISCVKLIIVLLCLTGARAWILTVPSLQKYGTLISASTQDWEVMEIHYVLLQGLLPPQDGS